MSSMKGDAVPHARLCHIVKWEDFDGYGFNLHAEKGKSGQFIGKVDEGSPSQAAGLRQGDRIVEVNEINIANESHKQVVDRIKAFPNEAKLLVVDREADDYFRTNGIIVKGTMTRVKVIKTPDKSPAIEQEARSIDGSNHYSIDENVHKSIGSNDTSNSGSDSTVAVALASDSPSAERARRNGNDSGDEDANGNGNGNGNERNDNDNDDDDDDDDDDNENGNVAGEDKGLNLKMSAKELRARLAARKKYDPKKESIGFKDKFDIVQKL